MEVGFRANWVKASSSSVLYLRIRLTTYHYSYHYHYHYEYQFNSPFPPHSLCLPHHGHSLLLKGMEV